MKRTALHRHAPLHSRAKLRTYAPIRSKTRLRARSSRFRRRQREWAAITREAIADAGGACQVNAPGVCTGRATQGHHRRPRGRGGKDTRANCVATCADCHAWIHQHPEQARDLGVLQ